MKKKYHTVWGKKVEIKEILNPNSKSNVVIFLDEKGNKQWMHKSKKGAIYGK